MKKVSGIKMASQLRVKNALMWVEAGVEIPQTANDKDSRTGGKYKKKYYKVKFTQTSMKHNQALIALARKRSNVLYATLRDGTYFHTPEAVATARTDRA